MRRWAEIDATGQYRYLLGREWEPKAGVVVFVFLKPSIAERASFLASSGCPLPTGAEAIASLQTDFCKKYNVLYVEEVGA